MKMRKIIVGIGCAFALSIGRAHAYDLGTHTRITLHAYEQSGLAAAMPKLGFLGMKRKGGATNLGKYYFDFSAPSGGIVYLRNSYNYENVQMPAIQWAGTNEDDTNAPSELLGWLLRGDIREDDGNYLLGKSFGDWSQPLDDPQGDINRFCNHFFDPETDQPMFTLKLPTRLAAMARQ